MNKLKGEREKTFPVLTESMPKSKKELAFKSSYLYLIKYLYLKTQSLWSAAAVTIYRERDANEAVILCLI